MSAANGIVNGVHSPPVILTRAGEVADVSGNNPTTHVQPVQLTTVGLPQLIDSVKSLILPFIRAADDAAASKASGGGSAVAGPKTSRTTLVESLRPQELIDRLALSLSDRDGKGKDGLLDMIQKILEYSVNTWDQGFLDKLYSSTNAVPTCL